MVVGDGIQMLVSDLNVSGTLFGKDGVALDDEGVAQLVASIVPQTGRGVAEQAAIAIVVDRIGDTQIVVHQRRHEVEVRGAMLEDV